MIAVLLVINRGCLKTKYVEQQMACLSLGSSRVPCIYSSLIFHAARLSNSFTLLNLVKMSVLTNYLYSPKK